MSKEVVKEENPSLSTTFFGWINTSLFLTYALFQLGTGAIGDAFPKRFVLAISFTIQAMLFVGVGLLGSSGGDISTKLVWFCILFGSIGAV